MIGDRLYECWNCGRTYDLDESEYCPKCGEYKNDKPKRCDDCGELLENCICENESESL